MRFSLLMVPCLALLLAPACSISSFDGDCNLPAGQTCCSGDVGALPRCEDGVATCPSGFSLKPSNECVNPSGLAPACQTVLPKGWAPTPYNPATARPLGCTQAALADVWKQCFSKNDAKCEALKSSADAARCLDCIAPTSGEYPYTPPFPGGPGSDALDTAACVDLKGATECAKAAHADEECKSATCASCINAFDVDRCRVNNTPCGDTTRAKAAACGTVLEGKLAVCEKKRKDLRDSFDLFSAYTSAFCGPL